MSISPPRRERGVALLMVLLGLAVLSVLALGLVLQTRAGVEETATGLQTSRLRALCDAVILQTAVSLLSPDETLRPRIDGVPQMIDVLGQKIPVTVTSEFGKVDLNSTDQATLTRLLIAAGLGPDEANQEANVVIASRGAGHIFREPAELMNAPGITPKLYTLIASSITVYSGRGQIDLSTAPLLALEAAGEDRQAAEDAIHGRGTDQSATAVDEVSGGKLIQGIGMLGWAFRVDADLTLGSWREHAAAVIRMTGDPLHPYYTLWRQERAE